MHAIDQKHVSLYLVDVYVIHANMPMKMHLVTMTMKMIVMVMKMSQSKSQFNVGDKVLYVGLWGSDFNKVDEVVGIIWDDLLLRNKYLIKESDSGEILTQYGDNYRLAEADEIAVGHRLRSNHGKNICTFDLNGKSKSESLL
ncbi:hypothetical protein [Acinetobacter sp. Ac_5812]|uniref:hypothetical protein n=1 Tax=Acinetobacter sp. Ac_5812 TaxID=1848937 RepID=UPI00148F60A0|nr:hypothetical protein [Acinetobacter sp. Ac_5812]NNP70420.1 hypothetical protein [Acinetobacter sp. Ac_5812]